VFVRCPIGMQTKWAPLKGVMRAIHQAILRLETSSYLDPKSNEVFH
jgi:hypothetical protein